MTENSTSETGEDHGTMETAKIDVGQGLPCPAEKVIHQEKWKGHTLIIWYEDGGRGK